MLGRLASDEANELDGIVVCEVFGASRECRAVPSLVAGVRVGTGFGARDLKTPERNHATLPIAAETRFFGLQARVDVVST